MKALSREHGKMKKRMDAMSGLLEDTDGQKVYNNGEYEKTGNTPTRGLSPHMGGSGGYSSSPQGRGGSPTGLSPKYQSRDVSADRERGHSSSRVNPKYAHESARSPHGGQGVARATHAVNAEMRGHTRDSRARTRTNNY